PKVFGYDFANVFSMNNQINFGKISLNQPVEEYKIEDITTIAGWLEPVNNGSALLWVNKNFKNESYFMPSEVLKDLKVKMGDRVVAEVSVDEKGQVVKKIFSINDCPVKSKIKPRVDFASIAHCSNSKPLMFKDQKYIDLNLKIGENLYVYGVDNNENTKTIVDMLNSCKIENKIYINISVVEKNKMLLTKLQNTENFIANITDDVDIVRRMILLALERAKRILEIGEDVLVVVDDMLSIVGIDKDNLNLVKNLASITKQGKKGSITLLSVMPNENIIQIEKLADKRLKISNGNLLIKN
ncbi:MAG: hypothetical protein IJ415_02645, partial [Clostridia bacterium]|nr:hypothetical protein [Clostridia bacterium]